MCFFHVLYNVRKRTRQLEDRAGAVIYKVVAAMHFTRSLLELYKVRDEVLAHWRKFAVVSEFVAYFEKQWLRGRYWRWQAFHSPMGYATTNNPCETFNASVKRHVMRKMFDTVRLLRKLVIITEDVTADKITPATSCGAPPLTLVKSARAMVHSRRLAIFHAENVAVIRVVQQQGQNEGFTHHIAVVENAFERFTTSKTTEGMEEHLARRQRRKASAMYGNDMMWSVYMAHKMKMPILGWTVNTDEATCQCCYFAKMGHCCHLVGAWILTGHDRLQTTTYKAGITESHTLL